MIGNPPWTSEASHSANKLSVRRSYAGRSELHDLIGSNLKTFSGEKSSRANLEKHKFDYISPDAVVIGRAPEKPDFVDGFMHGRLAAGLPRTAALKLIGKIGFASTF